MAAEKVSIWLPVLLRYTCQVSLFNYGPGWPIPAPEPPINHKTMAKNNIIQPSAPKTVSAGIQTSSLEAPSINRRSYVTIGRGRISADHLRDACWQASLYFQLYPNAELSKADLDIVVTSRRLHDKLLTNRAALQQDSTGAISVAGEGLSMEVLERILFMATMSLMDIRFVILFWWITYEIGNPSASPQEFASIAESWVQAPPSFILIVLKAFDAIAA